MIVVGEPTVAEVAEGVEEAVAAPEYLIPLVPEFVRAVDAPGRKIGVELA